MRLNTQLCAVAFVGLYPFADRLAGQEILTISHGQKVNINSSLARGKYTIVEFYADW